MALKTSDGSAEQALNQMLYYMSPDYSSQRAIFELRTGSPPNHIRDTPTGTTVAWVPVTYTSDSNTFNNSAANTTTNIVEATMKGDGGTPAKVAFHDGTSMSYPSVSTPGGTAGYFYLRESNTGTRRLMGTVTATGGGGELELSSTTISAGAPVTISSFKVRMTNAI